ncbi:ABC transporter permease subunit [Vibrio sp. ZSDZ34]|uniref:ABC transporter permease subunit n=1 Tax=Vibrio gelatinilyticus TaxID=2893468 RepID=A0A9X2B0A9_9VIBR|nr:ABC transporter permease subunit [Vibrio gelatinilyticus]MCJ2378373.1 ABC transporter permease subunit [Vibrio gelatinilyticus]
MPINDFSLQARDRKRLLQDRFVRALVSFGGLSVLGGLVFIFVYLAYVIFPIFSSAQLEWTESVAIENSEPMVFARVDDYATQAYWVTEQGVLIEKALTSKSYSKEVLANDITMVAQASPSSEWFALADDSGQAKLIRGQFSFDAQKAASQLRVTEAYNGQWFDLETASLAHLAVAVRQDNAVIASADTTGFVSFLSIDNSINNANASPRKERQSLADKIENIEKILLTPDTQTLYVLAENRLYVIILKDNLYQVREIIDLSQGSESLNAIGIYLLAGAHSVLVQYDNNTVEQWFDVLDNGERSLSAIREFKYNHTIQQLLPEIHGKGFYVYLSDGRLITTYTTTEKQQKLDQIQMTAVPLFGLSNNDRQLIALDTGKLNVAVIDNEYPEISFRTLWSKIWYESYPEPEFVWQTTAANDDFEPKFSLVPIAFGTIKSAAYAMIFSVPIAVFGAIYTAYFMSARMRKVVKPTIELMEALPTVIIGFLAGLWFAPIVESHLPGVMVLLVALPVMTVMTGLFWYVLPRRWVGSIPSGLHAIMLIPVIIIVTAVSLHYSATMEQWLFDGDVRAYLALQGIGYDQRNAMIVGFAMGFAVIPTIFTISEDAIFSVPKHLSDGSLALGATRWQTLTYVVLLTASPGIFSAVMMGLGRAVGETMIVLMATGNTPILDWNIFEGMRTLSATMAVELPESDVGSTHYRLLFLAALILFTFTFAVNSLAEWVRQRLRERYRAL